MGRERAPIPPILPSTDQEAKGTATPVSARRAWIDPCGDRSSKRSSSVKNTAEHLTPRQPLVPPPMVRGCDASPAHLQLHEIRAALPALDPDQTLLPSRTPMPRWQSLRPARRRPFSMRVRYRSLGTLWVPTSWSNAARRRVAQMARLPRAFQCFEDRPRVINDPRHCRTDFPVQTGAAA